MRFVFLILILVPNIIFADIVPFVEKMKDYPKNFVVSHFVTPSVSFFGGEMGYIYTHEKNAADLNWTSIQLKDAGLITSLAVSEGLNINDLDQRNKTLKTIQSIYVTSAKGSIYRSYMGTLDKNWVEVYASKQDAQGPLFDVTLLDDRRLLAVGITLFLLFFIATRTTATSTPYALSV